MTSQQIVLTTVLTFALGEMSLAQPSEPRFHRLTIEDGISQNSINYIHQDRVGFMWFGTQDGLNRYDGYDFKIFRHEPGNANSLGNNYVWTIYEDADGIFWIGTFGGGLTRFDPSTETFAIFEHEKDNPLTLSNNHIFSIVEYPKGTLWLCTDDGLNRFDKRTGLVTRYLNTAENKQGLPTNHLDPIAVQPPDNLWLGTNRGLARFNITSGIAEYFTTDPQTGTIPLGNVQHLAMKGDRLLIVSTTGLVECDFATGRSSLLLDQKKISDKTVALRRVLYDPRGYSWIGTNNGLILYDLRNKNIAHITHDSDNDHSLSHNNVLSLYQSREGIVWIGTRNGLNRIDRVQENFSTIKRKASLENTLSHKTVGPVLEDARGLVWLGTPDGLNAYDRELGKFTVFKHDPRNPRSIGSNYILSLFDDSNGNLWVGTRGGGLSRLTTSGANFVNPIFRNFAGNGRDGLLSATIHCIQGDDKGTIWIGTAGQGLAKFLSERGGFKHYQSAADGSGPSHPYVYCVFEDSFGNMWLGTPTGGLNLFDRDSERFFYIRHSPKNRSSLSNNIVLSIHEDASHALWVGTAGGLNKLTFPLRKNLFQYFQDSVDVTADSLFIGYGKKDGFPNEVIYGILEDDHRQLWLSTNRGVVVFDASKNVPVVKTFDASDGLQNNEFNQNGYFKNARGEMYFGGVDGASFFHPDSIRRNEYVPPVVFTDFRLFNKSVPLVTAYRGEAFALRKTISQTETLSLAYDHDVLSFEFAALNFIVPERNQYAYKMEGFDKDWTFAGAQRSVTYTNLDPGEYVLRVRASNNDGIWNEEGTALRLVVPPPPWLSWYAYLLYGTLASAAIALGVRSKVKAVTREIETQTKIERARMDEREQVRRQSSADFHDEAGHTLTKISLFTELARGEATGNHMLRDYLAKIEEHTKELSSGMRDFIWVLDPTQESLRETIHRLRDVGNAMFGYTDTKFNARIPDNGMDAVMLTMEARRALMLIFKEAMNNCVKYSSAAHAELAVTLTDGALEIALTDDGKGFDVNTATNGYGMKTMTGHAEKLEAKFSVRSSPGMGTIVRFEGNLQRL